jgi:predicted ABC-type ATPase
MSRPPLLIIFAGPNGSGKSTITAEYQKLPDFPTNYINPDQIVLSLNNENYARSVYEAAEIAEHQRGEALTNRTSFAFETVMSHPSKIEDIKQAKELDYRVEVIFVSTNDPEINVSRVRNRVSLGGHDVPEKKIRERYYRSLRLLPIILEVSDKVYLFDNSNPAPQLSATVEKGQVIQKVDNPPQWVSNVLDNLVERNTELNAIMSAAAVENSQKANINDANYTGVIHQITTNFIAQMVSSNSKFRF